MMYFNKGIDMTEDEARKKWCPMARVQGMESSGNRTDNAQCIASDCACWVDSGGDGRGNRLGHCGLIK